MFGGSYHRAGGENEIVDFGAGDRFGIRGALGAEQRAALRLLAMFGDES